MYSIKKDKRFANRGGTPACSEAFYSTAKSTNNANVSQGFTMGQRKMIVALGTSDNQNAEFYNPKIASSVKNFKSLASGPNRIPQEITGNRREKSG